MGVGFPHLVQMHEKFAKDGLAILTVTLDDPKDAEARAAVEKFLARKAPPFPTVNLDADPNKLPPTISFGGGVPGAFVFNRANRYVKKLPLVDSRGEETEKFSYEAIDQAVAEAIRAK